MKHTKSSLSEHSSSKHLLAVLGILVVTCLCYVPALGLEWIWDDDQYVTENALLRNWDGLNRIWFEPSASPQYYPTVFSVLWLQFQIFGLNPAVFHATNVILHAVTTVLVYRIVSDLKLPWPFWIALAFAVHPMQVESVAWVTELKNVLSGLFYACAWVVLWPSVSPSDEQMVPSAKNSREMCWSLSMRAAVALGLLFFALALLSKSVTASLPAGMLVALWFRYGRIPQRSLAVLLPMLLIGAVMGWNTARIERLHVGAEGADWSYGPLDRIGIAAHCLVHYAWQTVLPIEQVFFYKRFSTSFWNPANLFCVSLCGTLIVAFALLARAGNRGPLAACLFFAGSAFPALGFLNVYPHRFSFVADHFVYFPIAALLCLLFVSIHWGCCKVLSLEKMQLAALAPMSLCILYTMASLNYIPVYSNEITLWRDTLSKNPDCPAAMQNLGLRLVESGQVDEALSVLLRAAEFDFDRYQTFNSLGVVYKALGRFPEARQSLEQSLLLKPKNDRAWTNYAALVRVEGQQTMSDGWRDSARDKYSRAWEIRPTYLAAFGLGTLAAEQSDWANAELWFQNALELQPADLDAQYNRAYALLQLGRRREADELCIAMIRSNPRDHDVRALRKQIGILAPVGAP
jgi:protein O-mannosyl-transferase